MFVPAYGGGMELFMRSIYAKNTANYPRLATDTFFSDCNAEVNYSGFIDELMRYVEDFQLLDTELWSRLAHQFYEDADYDAGWRGEFWGKWVISACRVCRIRARSSPLFMR